MKKSVHVVAVCMIIAGIIWLGAIMTDYANLTSKLIRIHVVANSDTRQDQAIKLQVRDAVLSSIESDLKNIRDPVAAKAYLQKNLPKLQKLANQILSQLGADMDAVVTLCKEAFPAREYDTFRLPAGIYETLRITIGEGAGENWWCVAFPSLCMAATEEEFEAAAAWAGFSDSLSGSLRKTGHVEIRFYLMDFAGKCAGYFFQ